MISKPRASHRLQLVSVPAQLRCSNTLLKPLPLSYLVAFRSLGSPRLTSHGPAALVAAGGLQLLIGIIWYIMLLLARRNTAETSIPLRSQLDIDSQNTHGVKTDTRQGEFKGTCKLVFVFTRFQDCVFVFAFSSTKAQGGTAPDPTPPGRTRLKTTVCLLSTGVCI